MNPNVRLSTAQNDTRLGTALDSDISVWAENSSQDLDRDGLNDAWENAAIEQVRPTFLYPSGEDLFDNPNDTVALFTRVTPVELEDDDGNRATYITFLNTGL